MRSISNLSDLTGRVAIVTGGAGHIGRAMTEALVENGAKVVLADRNRENLAEVTSNFEPEQQEMILSFCIDLEEPNGRAELVDFVRSECGKLDILINNAGFVGVSALDGWAVPFEDQSIDTWRRALEVNLTAPFDLAQRCAPLLQVGGVGSIINIGSIYGVLGPVNSLYTGTNMANPAGYAASKGGLLQLTRWLATTLAPSIRANCISPGGLERGQDKEFVARYLERTPLARMGSEEDFKGVALFLASDLSAWVTGQNILVDGGWSAW